MPITYTSQTIASYNASPPADDGTTATTNEVTWAGIKTKLADPIKTLSEAINTEIINLASRGAGVTATNTFATGFGQIFAGPVALGTATFDADGYMAIGGALRLGTASQPTAGHIAAVGLQIGVTATAPSSSHMAIVGGIRMGTASEPTAGHVAAIGLRIGPTSTEAGSGGIRMTGALGIGTATQPANGRVNAVQLLEGGNRVVFTKSFTSTDIAMAASSVITLAHSLATSPKSVSSYLYTPSAANNYTATDRVSALPNIVADATNVFMIWGTGTTAFTPNDKSSATDFVIATTSTAWFLVIQAYA